jgi:hypothetical protein
LLIASGTICAFLYLVSIEMFWARGRHYE